MKNPLCKIYIYLLPTLKQIYQKRNDIESNRCQHDGPPWCKVQPKGTAQTSYDGYYGIDGSNTPGFFEASFP